MGLKQFMINNPKKTLAIAGLLALSYQTKNDPNLHFQNTQLKNISQTQYIWGFNSSKITIEGNNNHGDIKVFLLGNPEIKLMNESKLKGNIETYSLGNSKIELGDYSKQIGNTSLIGLINTHFNLDKRAKMIGNLELTSITSNATKTTSSVFSGTEKHNSYVSNNFDNTISRYKQSIKRNNFMKINY